MAVVEYGVSHAERYMCAALLRIVCVFAMKVNSIELFKSENIHLKGV